MAEEGREPNGRWKPGFKPPGAGHFSDYREKYCAVVVELGAQGKSKVQMAAYIGVSDQTLYNWRDAHPEFAEALRLSETLAQAWWEDRGQDGMEDKNFNHAVWGRTMGARFRRDWSEQYRQEITGADGAPLVVSWRKPQD